MKYQIKHEIKGRMRLHILQKLTSTELDKLYCSLSDKSFVSRCKVYAPTNDLMLEYTNDRKTILRFLTELNPSDMIVSESSLAAVTTSRELNAAYKSKLIRKAAAHAGTKLFLPLKLRVIILAVKTIRFAWKALQCLAKRKLEVPVLDATAITVSMLRRDYNTAGSVMFLLDIGEILEDWTHKKSVSDLAGSMSLNVGKVWLKTGEQSVLVAASSISEGDEINIRTGSMIPFDGTVTAGDAMVNQASLTGESIPVQKSTDTSVYAGTVVEEGELTVCVKNAAGSTRYEKIVSMIEDTEKLKSEVESKAEHLADKLVPYTFFGTLLVWLITRNITKALSVLMVDFSCALKLAMPVTVLSAIREANHYGITVKGGKFLEKLALANTIVFDKTGTLTKANPIVNRVIPFCELSPDELLRIAACLEEHFPHSIANAVVNAAKKKNLVHEEMHTKVEYVVAHGIKSTLDGKSVLIGSYHFVFEDMGTAVPLGYEQRLLSISKEYSRLYMAIDGYLAAIICVEDPLREEACEVIQELRKCGFSNIVMMTGDSKHTARAIAEKVGVDSFYSETLPEDKAGFILHEKAKGNTVVMIGDGINDSPALSSADVGIAISNGAAIAREIADITISVDDLHGIVSIRKLSTEMMKRIHANYRTILAVNGSLIALGVTGIAPPTLTATIHNVSTIGIGLSSTKKLI